jgi:enoyl-CoA hydratase/carnithine racemase
LQVTANPSKPSTNSRGSSCEGPQVTFTINRPEKRNALSTAMMTELNAELSAIGKQADARAVIIAGNGPAFSAGHDLGELKGRDPCILPV